MRKDDLSTANVQPRRQYDRWREAVSSTHLAWSMPARRDSRFAGHVNRRPLGAAEVLECACDPCAGRRGRAELARTEQRFLGVLCILSGRERISQPGSDTFLQAGHFTIWDSERPIAFDVPDRLHKITLMVPRDLLGAVPVDLGAHIGASFAATGGCAALFVAQLRSIATLQSPLESRAQGSALRYAFELLASAVGSASVASEPSIADAQLHARVIAYVRERLGDPDLCSEEIARAMGLSRRQLDRCFARTGTSLSRFIWSARLARCRQDILTDARAGLLDIAFRWGFSDAAHFSRAFRRAFGTSPRDYRARHRAGG